MLLKQYEHVIYDTEMMGYVLKSENFDLNSPIIEAVFRVFSDQTQGINTISYFAFHVFQLILDIDDGRILGNYVYRILDTLKIHKDFLGIIESIKFLVGLKNNIDVFKRGRLFSELNKWQNMPNRIIIPPKGIIITSLHPNIEFPYVR